MMVEKKSKFIASVCPCETEEEALDFLKKIKSKYPDATHNVYAYVIDENNIFRYSDDGEPQGTAGMPVLDTIRKEGIVDVCVVVTRYFGGTLLGTGGLVHAYGASASLGLNEAKIVTRALCNVVSVKVDYTMVGKLQHKIACDNLILDNTDYADDVTFYVCCLMDKTQKFIE
ncbi:MAG: YigZ family protein, partial [Clostridia bacterium]|nr:YigZ family protein [Clostridia bacterium]